MISTESTTARETYQDLFKQMASAIQEHLEIKQDLDMDRVCEIIDERVRQATMPKQLEISLPDGKMTKLDGAHCQFEDVIGLVEEGQKNILLVGPAGTGKTTLAKHVAKALDVEFGFLSLSAGITETHLFGRWMPGDDGKFQYIIAKFVELYEKPGVFLLDEVDAADPNVMVSVNAALANGHLANPVTGRLHTRHPNCIIIAAANTYGRGGDSMYVGRNALDAATLDRFVLGDVFVDYDRDLEKRIASALKPSQANELLAWVELIRGRVTEYKLKRVVSTRLVERATAAIIKGRTLSQVKERFFKSWSKDEQTKVGAL